MNSVMKSSVLSPNASEMKAPLHTSQEPVFLLQSTEYRPVQWVSLGNAAGFSLRAVSSLYLSLGPPVSALALETDW